MQVLGIDLAAQPASTAVVRLERSAAGVWSADEPVTGPDDAALVELARDVDLVALDAPLGWPEPFVAAVAAHQRLEPWLGGADRRPLTHRCTDDVVVELGWGHPMSVAADRLGSVAMRAALLQREWAAVWGEPAPRDGTGRLAEVYPAAALSVWGIGARGYKHRGPRGAAARQVREQMVAELTQRAGSVLETGGVSHAAVESDHTLDALVSALVGVAVLGGATLAPRDPEESRRAQVEGWVHVPTAPLHELVAGAAGASDGARVSPARARRARR